MNLQYLSLRTLLLMCFFSISSSSHAVEGMSSEEIAVREEHDMVSSQLYECFARHNVNPRNVDEIICHEEQIKMKSSSERFNKFMRNKESTTSLAERRVQFEHFEKIYSTYTERSLKGLHDKHCKTKWGSSDTTECQAIASQIRRKKIEKLH